MTAQEIFDRLLAGAVERLCPTCDRRIAGDPNKEVHKIGVCFKLTASLIHLAMEQGIDLIITHEPTFSQSDKREKATALDLKKWALLENSGLTVYRFHDHAHHRETDYIHQGFLQALDLNIRHKYPPESIGICRYRLEEPLTVRQLAERIRRRLGIEFVRVVGSDDTLVETLGLGLGCVGMEQVQILFDPGCDLFITGEVGEVCDAEAVRDACFFGERKALLILGHYGSEYAGMKLLAQQLAQAYGNAQFLDGGEVYHSL